MNEKSVEGIANLIYEFMHKDKLWSYHTIEHHTPLSKRDDETKKRYFNLATTIAERLMVDEEKIKEILTLRKVECLGETIADIIINKPIKVKEDK